ncbi:MAG TPA: GNAT family N-acetyltransferase [Candidatus Binatia bacterium]|nr:GNAT family N-acetyltransferase [Candidatus Binatia bacterium]
MTERLAKVARIELEASDGLALRQLVEEDAQAYFDLIDADREHFKYGEEVTSLNYPDVQSVLASIRRPNPDRTRFGIWDGDTMVGSINLTTYYPGVAEIGYWVGGQHTGHGYARRAMQPLVDYAFNERQFTRLIASVDHRNIASIKTLQRAGFQRFVGATKQIYELEKEEYV